VSAAILHVSGDYPDAIDSAKTPVIAELLALTRDRFGHCVYSINRQLADHGPFVRRLLRAPLQPHLEVTARRHDAGLTAVAYAAPSKGLYHRAMLERLADWIADDVERRNLRPALVHGHKLTIEGIVAERVAGRLGIPFAISIQGNTDSRILAVRPDLRRLFGRIFRDAAVVFPFAPWALHCFERRYGRRAGPTILLPCPTDADHILAPRLTPPRVMTAFHLRNYALKNAGALVAAAAKVEAAIDGFGLDIAGGGEESDVASVRREIARNRARAVAMIGPVPHADIQGAMNDHAGFAMVSHRESFGLVFIEALLAGCPILYPAGRAVDGYFDQSFAIAADPRDPLAIAEGLGRLARDQARLKNDLAIWQQSGRAEAFRRDAIAKTYGEGLSGAIATDAPV